MKSKEIKSKFKIKNKVNFRNDNVNFVSTKFVKKNDSITKMKQKGKKERKNGKMEKWMTSKKTLNDKKKQTER